MSHQRPNEPIAPANIPGEPLDPKIPPTQDPEPDEDGGLVAPEKEADSAFAPGGPRWRRVAV